MPQIERPDGLVVRFKSQTPPQPDLFFWAQVPLAQIGPAVAGLERALASTPAAAGPSTARSDPEPASTSAAQSSRIGASALAAALSSLQQARRPAPGPSLLAVLQPERLLPLLARNPALVEAVAPHLPEQHRGAEAIAHLISTPQFRHTLQVLEHALNSGQVTAAHFGVQAEVRGVVCVCEREFLMSNCWCVQVSCPYPKTATPAGPSGAACLIRIGDFTIP